MNLGLSPAKLPTQGACNEPIKKIRPSASKRVLFPGVLILHVASVYLSPGQMPSDVDVLRAFVQNGVLAQLDTCTPFVIDAQHDGHLAQSPNR